MRFKEILLRITGFSTPVFGVSWDPPKASVAVARKVLTYMEDRRVLFVPSEMESPSHCVESVLQIRRFLTDAIADTSDGDPMLSHLRAMRAACRKFLDTTAGDDRRIIEFGASRGHFASWVFEGAVGELRGVFGLQLAAIATMHGLSVEDGLATILPGRDLTDEEGPRR